MRLCFTQVNGTMYLYSKEPLAFGYIQKLTSCAMGEVAL